LAQALPYSSNYNSKYENNNIEKKCLDVFKFNRIFNNFHGVAVGVSVGVIDGIYGI